MGVSSGLLNKMILVLNRTQAKGSDFGIDGDGITWEEGDCLHANVTYAKGNRALNAGALDVYAVKDVKMRWTNKINCRSRVKYQGQIYQIIPETFQEDFQQDDLRFLMQLVVTDKSNPK